MTTRDFCYWLQGFFEVGFNHIPPQEKSLTSSQIQQIEKHLSLVFVHDIDPSMGNKEHQDKLNAIHSKPSLKELGKKFDFMVSKHGSCPYPGWKLSSVHGWYDPEQGVPRC